MTRPHVSRIYRVVAEVLSLEKMGIVAYQTILRDESRIEFNLDLDIVGDRKQHARRT